MYARVSDIIQAHPQAFLGPWNEAKYGRARERVKFNAKRAN